jgi:drug/metabolite transporter (DMT)-like permease
VAAVLLGLCIAAAFGSGDFVGGRASRTASTVAVLVVAQACSVVGALAVSFVFSADVAGDDLVYGALAGTVNVAGLGLLYHGLANHPAGVVAPIAAVVGTVVPVTWGLVQGERPSALVLAGCLTAIVAGALVARDTEGGSRTGVAAGAVQAVVAGVLLGSSLVLFAETSEASGQWPVFAARSAALVCVGLVALAATRRAGGTFRFPQGNARTLAAAAGLFDVAATSLLVVALREELMVVVAPFASLAPAFTVLLAWAITGERLHRLQRAGFALVLASLVLVAAG